MRRAAAAATVLIAGLAWTAARAQDDGRVEIMDEAEIIAPGVASTGYSEVRLTLSPDGRTALWFSRDRPGGPGGYDIWVSHLIDGVWAEATPVSFNTPGRDFDPAFSADGRYVYFCSDRPGGQGGDDIWRVEVRGDGFGAARNLGPGVNSVQDEFAPMPSPDGRTLLFSSDRPGGPGRHDLFAARLQGAGFTAAGRLSGAVNTASDEFDATFLEDGETIVFSRAPDMAIDRVDLFVTGRGRNGYDAGTRLPSSVNDAVTDTYGPMLDWSRPGRLTFSGRRAGAASMELYVVGYRLTTVP